MGGGRGGFGDTGAEGGGHRETLYVWGGGREGQQCHTKGEGDGGVTPQ